MHLIEEILIGVRCINKKIIISILVLAIVGVVLIESFSKNSDVKDYESGTYQGQTLHKEELFAASLCVAEKDVKQNLFSAENTFHAVLLADLTQKSFLVGDNLHERIYPASTTKLMTLYVALKYGPMDETVTVSNHAVDVPWDSSKAGLYAGDSLKFYDLLYGLMLPSGNDAALAVAESVSGSVEKFVKLMNKEAKSLGATNTHFTTPHGYHDEKHYTTIYDLYLILNAAIQDDTFCTIVSEDSYNASITEAGGYVRSVTWHQTNQFIVGPYSTPDGVTMIGGKTGTTNEAGACLTLYVQDQVDNNYIAIIMGAESKPILYSNMTDLLSLIVK